jgi:para-aminobenzoate synthetase component 1
MRPVLQKIATAHTPETLVARLATEPGVALLRGRRSDPDGARYALIAARPFLTFRAFGSRCEVTQHGDLATQRVDVGNPWQLLEALLARYEIPEEPGINLPLGGCLGYWGYDLRKFVEPKLRIRTADDLGLPDCHLGFYHDFVIFDHQTDAVWIVATGLAVDGSRSAERARVQAEYWQMLLQEPVPAPAPTDIEATQSTEPRTPASTFTRDGFISAVETAQRHIRAGDIYQVNLAQRLCVPWSGDPWELYRRLDAVSPAPFSAFLDCGGFHLVSSSPELFLRMSGSRILTCPIKGTRPRGADPERDLQLARELQASAKERAELVMITDLLRNDLGRVSEFGSVQVPDLLRLEKFSHVQHLVSTVEGRLRGDVSHSRALASCFPGGSITGAPKFRAMEIIDELEPVARGPYCGSLGYLGFNRESQLNIIIRTAICREGTAHFSVGAGIVADSEPVAEYEETMIKARGFLEAIGRPATHAA